MLANKHRGWRIRHIISIPFIWGMVVPMIVFDVSLEIYHHVCFRLYGIPRVKRAHYFLVDRSELKYITSIDKVNCIYCSYGNGLFKYASEIAARTETYWCGIKHKEYNPDYHPEHHKEFANYNDPKDFEEKFGPSR
jgi:hypothetical protein